MFNRWYRYIDLRQGINEKGWNDEIESKIKIKVVEDYCDIKKKKIKRPVLVLKDK